MQDSNEINQNRMIQMKQKLEDKLSPSHMDIQDDSHLHAGHAGAQTGKGHFTVDIKSDAFIGLSILKKHQLVYQSLDEMMQTDIHALVIKTST